MGIGEGVAVGMGVRVGDGVGVEVRVAVLTPVDVGADKVAVVSAFTPGISRLLASRVEIGDDVHALIRPNIRMIPNK